MQKAPRSGKDDNRSGVLSVCPFLGGMWEGGNMDTGIGGARERGDGSDAVRCREIRAGICLFVITITHFLNEIQSCIANCAQRFMQV